MRAQPPAQRAGRGLRGVHLPCFLLFSSPIRLSLQGEAGLVQLDGPRLLQQLSSFFLHARWKRSSSPDIDQAALHATAGSMGELVPSVVGACARSSGR